MESAKIVSKEIVLLYQCNKYSDRREVILKNFDISEQSYFEDWQYTLIKFICPICGEKHLFEV